VKEFVFIKGQRDKSGSIGPHQIGLPDISEKRKLLKRQMRREENRKWLDEHKQGSEPDISLLSDEHNFSYEESEQEMADVEDEKESYEESLGISNVPSTSNKGAEYKKIEIPNVVLQRIRHGEGY